MVRYTLKILFAARLLKCVCDYFRKFCYTDFIKNSFLILELSESVKKQIKRRSVFRTLSNVYDGIFAKIINGFQQLTIFAE